MSGDPHKILAPLEEYLIKLEDFTMEKRIGKGGYGEVWLATHNHTGQKCAVKKLFLEELEGPHLNFFVREVTILASCHDFFLLPFMGFTDTAPFTIVTEFISNGSLFEALQHKHGAPKLSSSHKTLIAIGIAHGMIELHRQNIIHRDLKSLNILLDDRLLPKICDFGISRFGNQGDEQMTKEIGTPHWMAPEIFESNHYTEKVDVYAYGMILWEMLTDSVPFRGRSAIQVATAVVTKNERPAIPSSCPGSLRKLIQLCWDRDPDKRPSFKQIYNTFCDRKVMYRDTDPRSINAILTLIKEEENKMSVDPLQHLISRRAKAPAKSTRGRSTTVNILNPNNLPPPLPAASHMGYNPSPGSNPFVNMEAPVIRPPIRNQTPPPQERPVNVLELPRGNSQPYIANIPPSGRQNSLGYNQVASQPYNNIPNNAPVPQEMNIFLNNDPIPPVSRARADSRAAMNVPQPGSRNSKYKNQLSNYQAPDFPQTLRQIMNSLTLDDAIDVFKYLQPYLKPNVPMHTTQLVLAELVRVFRRDISLINPFCTLNLQNELPFHYQGFIAYNAEIIFVAISQNPTYISPAIMSALAACVPSFPEQIIYVFANYASKIQTATDEANYILKILISVRNDYANIRFALHYIRILYNLYLRLPWFRETYVNETGQILMQFFSNSDVQLLVELYNFTMTFKELRQFVPLEKVVTHIGYPPLSSVAISFLIHLDNVPSSKRIVSAILAIGPSQEGTVLLCRIAEQQVGAQIILEHPEWMDYPPDLMFLILSSVFTVKAYRRVISEHPRFPALLMMAASSADPNIRLAIPTIVRRAALTADFVVKLNQVGFISRFIQISRESIEAISGCIMMCDALARVCYVSGFDDFVPLLPSMLSEQGNLALSSLTLTLVLYTHKEMREKIKVSGVKEVLMQMRVTPNFEQYRAVLLNQLNKDDS